VNNTDFTACPCDSSKEQVGLYYFRYKSEETSWSKRCYLLPTEPLNVRVNGFTSTEIYLSWSQPTDTDELLRTQYSVYKNGKAVDTTETDALKHKYAELIPFTFYNVKVCSYNDATKSRIVHYCSDDLKLQTKRSIPGEITDFSFKRNSSTLTYLVAIPTHLGSDTITIKVDCVDDNLDAEQVFKEDNIESTNHISIRTPCIKVAQCSIYASNEFGNGPSLNRTVQLQISCGDESSGISSGTKAAIAVIICLAIFIVFAILVWYRRWKKKFKKKEISFHLQLQQLNHLSRNEEVVTRNIYVDPEDMIQVLSFTNHNYEQTETELEFEDDYNPVEIDPKELLITKRLGEGNFGFVYKGEINNVFGRVGKTVVAIKVLKESVAESELTDFLEELETMKLLKKHPNVVRLLGYSSKEDSLFMAMEYLPGGDLQDFLRHARTCNPYENVSEVEQRKSLISEKDMMNFAINIAAGMNHLANNKIVHRDLACRNILLSGQRVCKVADLGMAKHLNEDGVHLMKKLGKIPIKWMAPEGLNGIASVKTDVWSYGIVLWEIVNFGSSPYPGYKSKDVVLLLSEGYRMPKPDHCNNTLYYIMVDCWQEDSSERPSFEQLESTFNRFLTEEIEVSDLDNSSNHYHSFIYIRDIIVFILHGLGHGPIYSCHMIKK